MHCGAWRTVARLSQHSSRCTTLATTPWPGGGFGIGVAGLLAQVLRGFSYQTNPAQELFVVLPREQPVHDSQEALRLAETWAGTPCQHVTVGPAGGARRHPATFFGRGTVASVGAHCQALQPHRVFVNAVLSSVQQRNLEASWGAPVLDRVALIIGIFGQRADTAEARLQVEMAELEYRSSRLVRGAAAASGGRAGFGEGGATEVVSARERGRSGAGSGGLGGAGGGGESELQLQRSRIRSRLKYLRTRLEEVRRTREVQRAGRRRSGKPLVAVVGYTNAGKSSLVAALSRQDLGVRDRLFETLDPRLRAAELPSGRQIIVSDTVGFISGLPPQLVRAFRATLEEVAHADLLLHVLDAAAPQVAEQRRVVQDVLRELGVSEETLRERVIEVWNKVDLLGGSGRPVASAVPSASEAAAQVAASAADVLAQDHFSASTSYHLSPPTHDLSPPTHGASPAVHDISPPAHAVARPLHAVSLPLHGASPPADAASPPAHSVSMPAHDALPPVHDFPPSVRDGRPGAQRDPERLGGHAEEGYEGGVHRGTSHMAHMPEQNEGEEQEEVEEEEEEECQVSDSQIHLEVNSALGMVRAMAQAGEEGDGEDGKPVRVLTSVRAGIGLQDLLYEIERKVQSLEYPAAK